MLKDENTVRPLCNNSGFVWSLMSTKFGGFLEAADVSNVQEKEPGILVGTVERNYSGTFKIDHQYEFFEEQFIRPSQNIFELPELYTIDPFSEGDMVKVYSRQTWGSVLDNPINGIVYQKQIGRSVIVSVHPDHCPNKPINSFGGVTIEVYAQQLRHHLHEEKHVTLSTTKDAKFNVTGYDRHKLYQTKKSIFETIKSVIKRKYK
jgi:hypothetical protein